MKYLIWTNTQKYNGYKTLYQGQMRLAVTPEFQIQSSIQACKES